MARIDLREVNIEFPVYNINARSFKKRFLRLATGGSVMEDANKHIVVSALRDINLTLEHGDRIGLIGHNGAGKSTFLKLLAGIYEPTQGNMLIDGHVSCLLDIMQGIEAEFTGHENIIMRGTLLGLSRKQISEKIDEISEFTGLGDYLSMPIRTYSSGMQVRLAFAISAAISPEILLIDEVLGVGDANFLEKARQKIASLLDQSSIVIMASHANESIKQFCNKALLLENGCVKYFGSIDEAFRIYTRNKTTALTSQDAF
jgi:ABC-type polysaccharide/polyol phosphate transport system ATPase subunit